MTTEVTQTLFLYTPNLQLTEHEPQDQALHGEDAGQRPPSSHSHPIHLPLQQPQSCKVNISPTTIFGAMCYRFGSGCDELETCITPAEAAKAQTPR